jgi:hypothetical protein
MARYYHVGVFTDVAYTGKAQGRFTGRPSRIAVTAYGTPDNVSRVTVGGAVTVVGTGALRTLPAEDQA